MKNIFKILLAGFLVASCGDVEPVTFNGEGDNNFLSFSRSTYNLPVVRDANGSVNIVLNASTLSSTDRTYNLELVPNNSALVANPATYTLPGSVTIPAGEYSGVAVITGVDNGLVDAVKKNFIIKLTNLQENDSFDTDLATVLVYEVCPLGDPEDPNDEPFLGEYAVDQTTSVSLVGFDVIPAGTYVLSPGETEYDRYMTFKPYGESSFNLDDFKMLILFGCDDVNISDEYNTFLSCEDDGGAPYWVFGPTEDPIGYNRLDDSSFELRLTENLSSACGQGTRNVNITFTKVE